VTAMRGVALLCIAAVCCSAIVRADELPHRRPGLWEITRINVDADNPARTSKICIDGATEAMLRDMGTSVAKSICDQAAVSVSGNAVSVDTVCRLDRSRLTSHTVITFTSDTAYHHVAATHFDPPLFGRADSTSEMDGKWLGPCAADMRPGDVITAMGKINLVDRARSPK
jgi:Protein of unknown function (DUF3617)